MPDITMCKGGECPRKETCFRFTATPHEFGQSYFNIPPLLPDMISCQYFLPMFPKSKKR